MIILGYQGVGLVRPGRRDVIPHLLDILHYPSCAWREMGNVVRFLSEEEGFWDIYRATTAEVLTRGNLAPDAHLAALLRHRKPDRETKCLNMKDVPQSPRLPLMFFSATQSFP